MSKAIDDIKRIRDFLNEATIDPNARGPYSIASSSPIKKAEPMKSPSVSGSAQSVEDRNMNILASYAKKLQTNPDSPEWENAIHSIIFKMRAGSAGNWKDWQDQIEEIYTNFNNNDQHFDINMLMKFINDYKQSKTNS